MAKNIVQPGTAGERRAPANDFISNLKIRLKSRLQMKQLLDNGIVSFGAGCTSLCASAVFPDRERRLKSLASATRRLDNRALRAVGRPLLKPWISGNRSDIWREKRIGWSRYSESIQGDKALITSLLLKEPGENGEKGVLYCSFEYNWMKILANHDARSFFKDYFLVGASSWSPTDPCVLANLCGLSEDPVFIGISNKDDVERYKLFSPHVFPLPIMACDWVDPRNYSPLPHDRREIDLLMVSHTAYWKRHWLLFQALKNMRRDLNVVLIGRVGQRGVQDILDEARAFGVKQDITFLPHLEIDEVMKHQCNAKVSLALSKREGSCVSVTEALFADSPVGIMKDAHIGAKAYINESTGRILTPGSMAGTLSEMVERSGEFKAREWAVNNVSAQMTSKKLNDILRDYSLRAGKPWTRDIAPMCWRYVPRYLYEEDKEKLANGLAQLREKHGIELEEFVSEKSARLKHAKR